MTDLLERLEAWLSEHRSDALETMNPGLGTSALAAFEKDLGVRLPDDVRAYFRWRDGQDSDTYECIPPDEWEFLPSSLVVRIKAQMDRDHQGTSPDGSMDLRLWWRPGFIPFLCDPSGGYLCLDSSGSVTGEPWIVVEFKHDTNDLTVRHDSFKAWLETTVQTLEAGLYDWNDDGDPGITNKKQYDALYNKLNPGLPRVVPMVYRES